MRKIWLWMTGMMTVLAACDKVTVGYLITDEAAYPVNRMEIYNIGQRIADLKQVQVDFKEAAGPVQKRYDDLNTDYKAKQKAYVQFNLTKVQTVEDSVMYVLDAVGDAGKIEALKKRLDEELYPERDRLKELADIALMALQGAEREIEELCVQMGIASVIALDNEVTDLERRVKYNIPWSTSTIEGVLGTEPMNYEVMSVKNAAHPEDAARFQPYVGMMGGGRIYVRQEVDAPAGEYIVTVRVWNEGRSAVLEDAFTFVVK